MLRLNLDGVIQSSGAQQPADDLPGEKAAEEGQTAEEKGAEEYELPEVGRTENQLVLFFSLASVDTEAVREGLRRLGHAATDIMEKGQHGAVEKKKRKKPSVAERIAKRIHLAKEPNVSVRTGAASMQFRPREKEVPETSYVTPETAVLGVILHCLQEKKERRRFDDDARFYKEKYLSLVRETKIRRTVEGHAEKPRLSDRVASGETSNPAERRVQPATTDASRPPGEYLVPLSRINQAAYRVHRTFHTMHCHLQHLYGMILQGSDQVTHMCKDRPERNEHYNRRDRRDRSDRG
ncbi:hypothetical protein KSP40_PGU022765 [Platanthera guangdongensis]|uniref:Uncharacterized protein n=1 Tax=Platanthera guangdongensis TaxID=2320717 RepID=A0ABR2MK67_9ASPA